MNESPPREHLREQIDADLPADELDRLAHVDALLRIVAARDRVDAGRNGRVPPDRRALERPSSR